MANKSVSVGEIIDSIDGFEIVQDAELSSWEFVSQPQSDDKEELYSFTDTEEQVDSEREDVEKEPEMVARESDQLPSRPTLVSAPPPSWIDESIYQSHPDYNDGGDDDDDDEESEGSALDDELVPLKLKERFGKQRIRKIGKRIGSKVNKSKKVAYYYNRPGCVYGKHGLGVQHCFI